MWHLSVLCEHKTIALLIQVQYRTMLQAKKEGNAEIASKLEEALRTAMAEKQKHLRPEIRLLNELMQIQGDSQRQKVGHSFPRLTCQELAETVGRLSLDHSQPYNAN